MIKLIKIPTQRSHYQINWKAYGRKTKTFSLQDSRRKSLQYKTILFHVIYFNNIT